MKRKILVADDSISIQKLVAMAFYNEDIEVEGISEGAQAFEFITKNEPDLVMADVYLPGANGFELSKQIKTNAGLQNVKVLLLTSDFEELDEIMYADSQADDHISKPFKTEEIINKVNSLLGDTAPPVEAETPAPEVEDVEEAEVATENENTMNETMAAAASGGGGSYIVETISIPRESASAKIIELSAENLVRRPANIESEEEDQEEEDYDAAPQPFIIPANALLEDDFEVLDELFHQLTGNNSSGSNGEPEPVEVSPESMDSDRPDLIRETLSYFGETPASDPSKVQSSNTVAPPIPMVSPRQAPDSEPPTLDEQIHEAIEKSMNASMRSGMAGLSDTIVQTVGEIVKEVAPNVIRQVVQEEIEQIKKSEQG